MAVSFWANEHRPEHQRTRGDVQVFKCTRCLEPFEIETKLSGLPRNSVEYEPLRRALKIQDHTYNPELCDLCVEIILSTAPIDEDVIRPPNFLLRECIKAD